MRILKYNENSEDLLKVIKEYFYNITEDLSELCKVVFSKYNENLYKVNIYINNSSDNDALSSLISNNENIIIVLKELKSTIFNLINEDVIDDYKIKIEYDSGYINLILNKVQDLEKWILIDDWEIYFDDLSFKRAMKNKFNVNIERAIIEEYYDSNIRIIIHTSEKNLDEIIEYLKNYKIKNPYYGGDKNVFIFTSVRKSNDGITCNIRYEFEIKN